MMATAQAVNRALCDVVASHGLGIAAHLLTIRLDSPDPDLSVLLAKSLAAIADQPGITGAHLLQRDVVAPVTKERQARQRPDGSSALVALIEGYDPGAVMAIAKQFPALANPAAQVDRYQLAQTANAEDAT